ncbi:Inward rectifier potassium channel irk-1 [Trichinella spiralis]|uniref:Inward rectifier potassium channel irk-1 n=1 Tax=Trichinella spiralis TaxID=6334 RepID=A0A0V1BWJ5_TRISP|nr:Inward rectifier potassium channel irk-1 [Trichinella spiralis]
MVKNRSTGLLPLQPQLTIFIFEENFFLFKYMNHIVLRKERKKTGFLQQVALSHSFRSFGAIPFVISSNDVSRRLLQKKVKRSRLVKKNGEVNVTRNNVPKLERQYIRDLFTTLLDVKWRYSLVLFSGFFVISWIFFAVIYYVICWLHGDLQHNSDEHWTPCITNVFDFTSIFLFSVESQHTIVCTTNKQFIIQKYITTNCSSAITVLCAQSIYGLLIQSFIAGIVFAKLARPKNRAETLIFSKYACISLRNGQLCFLFRVGDMRDTHLVEAHVRLQIIRKTVTEEGEILPLDQHEMDVGFDRGLDRVFLVWPMTICHVIDYRSPLYEYSAESLASAQFEVVAILEGIVESTGMTAQALTSYLPSEINWGHRFEKLFTYQKVNGGYQVDWSLFHNTYAVRTPHYSAKKLEELKVTNVNFTSQYYDGTSDDGFDSETHSSFHVPSGCSGETTPCSPKNQDSPKFLDSNILSPPPPQFRSNKINHVEVPEIVVVNMSNQEEGEQ